MWLLFIYSFMLHNSQNNNFYFSVISTTQNTLTFKFFYQGSHSFFSSPLLLAKLRSLGAFHFREKGQWVSRCPKEQHKEHTQILLLKRTIVSWNVSPLQRCSLEQLCVFQKDNYRQKPMKGNDLWPEKVTSS